MRLMYSTALASALLFAGPALAAGDKVEGTTGMTSPEASAAQLPGQTADTGMLSQNFASAGFQDWQEARDAQILHMETGDGNPVWVILMPSGFEVGAAGVGEMDHETGGLAEAPGSALDQQDLPDVSDQAAAGDMPQRGEQADVTETFDADRPDVAEAPELGEQAEQPDIAEGPELGEQAEQPDIAEAPDLGEQGIVGQTEPEGFAAAIPGELRSDLEGAGFHQIESVDGADIFHAKTQAGQTAFIIVGDLTGFGFDGQQAPGAPGLGEQAPGVAPDLPEPSPGATSPQPAPGGMQQ